MLKNIFKDELAKRINLALPFIQVDKISLLLEKPPQKNMGDIAFPLFGLSKELDRKIDELGEELLKNIKLPTFISKAEVVKGYVNFFLNPHVVVDYVLNNIISEGDESFSVRVTPVRTIVIDYSSPNIAKPFGIGHLRSTNIGNALANILEFLGHRCVRINYLGDWGTQFGKLISAIQEIGLTEEKLSNITVRQLNDLYIDYNRRIETEEGFREKAKECFKRLENGEPRLLATWKIIKEISLKEFQRIYDLLGIEFDEVQGESEAVKDVPSVIKLLEEKGLLKESQNAKIVDLEKHSLGISIIEKSDNTTTYESRELAMAISRYLRHHFDEAIYVTGREQELHFKQLSKILELLGFNWSGNIKHISFGLIRFKGKKMSTRTGQIIYLEEVLNESINRVSDILKAQKNTLNEKEYQEIARYVGIGAIKFFDLKSRRIKDIDFNWEQILNLSGDSGPYLQYTYVRLHSIFEKFGGFDIAKVGSTLKPQVLQHTKEFELCKLILDWQDAVKASASLYEPSIVATYLLELASVFNNYYEQQRIITEDKEATITRLTLCYAVKYILKRGLELLGVCPIEKM